MKKIKGITLVALVITVTVLIILTSIVTYTGIDVIQSSKLATFTAEMKIMQTQVNAIYQKYLDGETIYINGTPYSGNDILNIGNIDLGGQAEIVFTETASGITDSSGYKYWSKDLIKELGIEGVEQDYFVNVKKRSIVSCNGLKYDEEVYYVLSQLPDNLYNVEFENPNNGKPTFEVSVTQQGEDKWKVNISQIEYETGYINKWKVKYILKDKIEDEIEDNDLWLTSNSLTFEIKEKGIYLVEIFNGDIQSEPKSIDVGM